MTLSRRHIVWAYAASQVLLLLGAVTVAGAATVAGFGVAEAAGAAAEAGPGWAGNSGAGVATVRSIGRFWRF